MNIQDLKENPTYLPLLAKWHYEQWSYLYPDETLGDRIEKMGDYLNNDFIPSTFVAIDDGLLGSAAIIECDMETRKELTPWLASVYVSADHRNKGVGSRLVRHVMQQAKHYNIETLYLFTPDQEHFYSRLGWQIQENTVYSGHKVTIMRVQLIDAS